MKHKLSLLVGLASLAALVGAIADTAVTDPVGYITIPIAGNATNGAFGADTLISPSLIGKTEYSGVTSSAPTGSSLAVAAALPANVVVGQLVELKGGASEGFWSTITAVSGDKLSVTLSDAVPSGLASGQAFTIRAHTTINSFLGANLPGLAVTDEVQILDGASQVVNSASYYTVADGAPAPGWYDSNSFDKGSTIIYPGSAVKIRRKAAAATSFVQVGYVKTTKTEVDLFTGDNWVTPMLAVGAKLGGTNPTPGEATATGSIELNTGNVATGVKQGKGDGTLGEDNVIFINSDQTTSTFFAADPAQTDGAVGWFNSNAINNDAFSVAENIGFIVRRTATPGVWRAPKAKVSQ